ncbi:MAG TPA: PIN domain-containing protein [Agitococcus sp.]|nr:PIN domain-containing protein [Pseudomonadales bacterium]MCB1674231.1 PIN domain-containing protein [Pseudomonadales bacterium]HQV21999.1 PIN domain-containing protein [Agitococcus sp.]
MTARAFVDTNVLVYSQSNNGEKTQKAALLLQQNPVISTQVINEAVSVLTRKYGVTRDNAYVLAELWMEVSEVEAVTVNTIRQAMRLSQKHLLSHWDALIVAAALLAGCTILYSEDMQHGYMFEGVLQVVNPFLN